VSTFLAFLQDWSYVGIFTILFLCGLGLPIPEELTLLAGGYLAYQEYTNLYQTQLVCLVAILLGDLCAFFAGRRYGMRFLEVPWMRRVLTPPRMDKVHHTFARYGAKTVFAARFFVGVRVAAFFVAGTLRMPTWKFLALDGAAALISVPASVWLGYFFGSNLDQARRELKLWHNVLIGGLLTIALVTVAVHRWRRHRRRAAAAAAAPGSAQAAHRPESMNVRP
jgi:membrane protein DedA with SNARE-associated domain